MSRPAELGVGHASRRALLATAYRLAVGLFGLGILGHRLVTDKGRLDWPAILVFAALSLLIQRSSFRFGSPAVHSLSGVIDVAAVLALGPTAGAVVAALSGLTYLAANALHHHVWTRRDVVEVPLFDAGLKACMALLGGALFQGVDGSLPIGVGAAAAGYVSGQVAVASLDLALLVALCALSLLWFVLDHLGWGVLDYLEGGRERLRTFLQDAIPYSLLVELLPLPASLVVALVYTRLSWLAFALVALGVVAIAVLAQRWADARNELVQRVAELTTIEQVGRAIAQAQLDVDELCTLIYERASQIVDTTNFQLGLFDGDNYAIRLWIRDGQRVPERTFPLKPGIGLVNWLRASKQPLLVHDFQKEMESLPARPAYESEDPPRSALFVPLVAAETAIGAMSIQSFRRNAFGDSDLRVVSAMANQAAVAIQKAELVAQERKRARQLETIGQTSRQVAAVLELDELFQRTVRLIRENFFYYHVAIFTVDPEREEVTFQASASAGERDVSFGVDWGQGLIGWVAAHKQAALVNDVRAEPQYQCVEALDETRSELVVPLLAEDELVGLLDVQSDQINAFGSDDLFILETLGDQIAVAIQEARLYEAEQQQAWFSTALLQVADTTSQVSDMDAVLTTIVRLTPMLVGVDRCAILLWDEDAGDLAPTQTYGLPQGLSDAFQQMRFAPGAVPAFDLVRLDRRPVVVDIGRDRLLVPRELVETFNIQELVVLPLWAQGEFLGAMLVDYAGRAHGFNERMIEMLTGIGNQAAMVIQSARLVQAQQEEAYVSMALLQAAEAVSRSNDLDEILGTIARITPMLVGVETCIILLRDAGNGGFWPFQQYGLSREAQAAFWPLRLGLEDALVQQIMAGEPFVTHWPSEVAQSLQTALAAGGGALLVLPLMIKGEVVGAMIVVDVPSDHYFTQRRMNILIGIANQAAIAVESDRLLQEATEQERMKQELDVARRIQTSFLPESCPHIEGWELATLWRSAREVSGDFYDFFPLPPTLAPDSSPVGRTGAVIADVADKGVPAALFMALCRTLVRTMAMDGRPPDAAIGRANDLILTDARSGLFVTLFYTILHAGSGAIEYVNAGHLPPLLVRAGDGAVEELRTGGMALGLLAGAEYGPRSAWLDPGDLLVLYTDGITEALDRTVQMFGRQRLIETVRSHRHQSAEDVVQAIAAAIDDFVGDEPQFDDLTLVVAKRRPA